MKFLVRTFSTKTKHHLSFTGKKKCRQYPPKTVGIAVQEHRGILMGENPRQQSIDICFPKAKKS